MRLIDADALMEKAFGKRDGLIHTSDIDAMPPVDAAPVVRCRDCVHLNHVAGRASTGEGIYKCDVWKAHTFNGDCFCSYGEKEDKYNGNDN